MKHLKFWLVILMYLISIIWVCFNIINNPHLVRVEAIPNAQPKIDYTKLIGLHEDEAEAMLHNIPFKGRHVDNPSPPHGCTWTINNLKVKLAVVNDTIIGVSLGDMNWEPKAEDDRK